MAKAYEVYADSRQLTREQWLQHRRSGIGGSDAGAIMGVHPYKGPYSVWADKTGYEMTVNDTEALRQGRDLEEYVARRFSEKTGLSVQHEFGMLRSKVHPCMVANIDRRIRGQKAGLECKMSFDPWMKRYKGGDFPMEYYCQCLHYMAVTGWATWYLAVVVAGKDVLVFKICRGAADEQTGVDYCIPDAQEDIDALIRAEEEFWTDYVIGPDIPVPDSLESTTRALDKVWADSDGSSIYSTPEDDMLIELLISYKSQKKAAEAAIRKIENQLKGRMRTAEELRGTSALITWKPQTQRRISEKLIRERYPDVDISKVRDEVEVRRFAIKVEEEDE